MDTNGTEVKSILLQERAKIFLYSEPRWGGAQVVQKNSFSPIPEDEQTEEVNNNCICINLG